MSRNSTALILSATLISAAALAGFWLFDYPSSAGQIASHAPSIAPTEKIEAPPKTRPGKAPHAAASISPSAAATPDLSDEARRRLAHEIGEARKRERYDQPAEAAEFYRMKRAPEGETQVPVER